MNRAPLIAVALLLLVAAPAMAQDPTIVDPDHYKVEYENDQIRVLRITYGPHEKSVMHEHPDSYSVALTSGTWKMTNADGEVVEEPIEAGASGFRPAEKHQPQNMSDETQVVVLVELKSSGND